MTPLLLKFTNHPVLLVLHKSVALSYSDSFAVIFRKFSQDGNLETLCVTYKITAHAYSILVNREREKSAKGFWGFYCI